MFPQMNKHLLKIIDPILVESFRFSKEYLSIPDQYFPFQDLFYVNNKNTRRYEMSSNLRIMIPERRN